MQDYYDLRKQLNSTFYTSCCSIGNTDDIKENNKRRNMEKMANNTECYTGNMKARNYWKYLRVYVMIILKCV
jgi:hypothetical protein